MIVTENGQICKYLKLQNRTLSSRWCYSAIYTLSVQKYSDNICFFSEVGYFRILHYATILHTCQWNRTEHLGAATHNPTVMSDGAFIHYLRDESERQNQTSNINITRCHSFSCVSQCNQMVLTWKFQHWVSVSPEEQRQLRGQIPYRCSWFHLNHWLRGCLQTSGHVIVYF